MKRSAMIAKLKNYFFGEEVRPENFCGFSNKFIEDFSDSILTFLERQGMKPPAYEKAVLADNGFGFNNNVYIQTFVNEWEPEDDQH